MSSSTDDDHVDDDRSTASAANTLSRRRRSKRVSIVAAEDAAVVRRLGTSFDETSASSSLSEHEHDDGDANDGVNRRGSSGVNARNGSMNARHFSNGNDDRRMSYQMANDDHATFSSPEEERAVREMNNELRAALRQPLLTELPRSKRWRDLSTRTLWSVVM